MLYCLYSVLRCSLSDGGAPGASEKSEARGREVSITRKKGGVETSEGRGEGQKNGGTKKRETKSVGWTKKTGKTTDLKKKLGTTKKKTAENNRTIGGRSETNRSCLPVTVDVGSDKDKMGRKKADKTREEVCTTAKEVPILENS